MGLTLSRAWKKSVWLWCTNHFHGRFALFYCFVNMDWKVILRKCLTLNQMKHRFSTAYPPSALVHFMVTLLRLFRREIKAKRAIRNWHIPQHRVDLKYRRECWLGRGFSHSIFWENSITFHSWRIKLVFVMADNHSHLPFLLAHRDTISKIISWLKKGREKTKKTKNNNDAIRF